MSWAERPLFFFPFSSLSSLSMTSLERARRKRTDGRTDERAALFNFDCVYASRIYNHRHPAPIVYKKRFLLPSTAIYSSRSVNHDIDWDLHVIFFFIYVYLKSHGHRVHFFFRKFWFIPVGSFFPSKHFTWHLQIYRQENIFLLKSRHTDTHTDRQMD